MCICVCVWQITFKTAQQLGKQQPVKTLNIYSHSVAGKPTSHKIDLTFLSLVKTFNACMFIYLCLYCSPMDFSGFWQSKTGREHLKLWRAYNIFAPLVRTMTINTHRALLDMLVSVPRVQSMIVSLLTFVFVPSHWSVVPYFKKSFKKKIPVGSILLFSRSLRVSFLDPDLPAVWQTKLSVRIVQFFHFPCYVLNQFS